MNISLSKVKISKFASHETTCFEATILIDGKAVGSARNDGNGGATFIYPRSVEERLEKYAAALPAETIGKGKQMLTFQPTAETLIDDLVIRHQAAQALKRLLKDKVVFVSKGKLYSAKFSGGIPADAKKRLNADLILNTIPENEAVSIYLKHAKNDAESLYLNHG